MGKNGGEELVQLLGEKTVEEEVRNNQVVVSGGLPLQGVGVMQVKAMAGLLAAALLKEPEHGLAGVDNIGSKGRICCQQAR